MDGTGVTVGYSDGAEGQDAIEVGSRRRWPFVVTVVALVLLALGLGYLYFMATKSAQEWRATANRAAQDLTTMTGKRDAAEAQLRDSKNQLSDMTTKYNDASDRIRSLSNEKAQIGDEATFLASAVLLSQQIGMDMDSCIGDLKTLETYLIDYRSYDPSELSNYARQIHSRCDQVRADSEALTRKLTG